MNSVPEEWSLISDDFPDYAVSDQGRVRNLRTDTLLTPYKNSHGYLLVKLANCGTTKSFRVHRLVAEAFVDNPDEKTKIYVHHKDHDKKNNTAENLEWVTAQENTDHEVRPPGYKTRKSQLKSNKKYRNGRVQLTFLLTENENAELLNLCEKSGMSRTRIIRTALCEYLAEGGGADGNR